ncbi:hypothetical protein PFISCL1PPCAC_15711 [Pristionchus fissidentatus]|uniref:BING4 C-terminal domain-containing protein n=1 Tax=Pristionchus fissidentatus TaxID=1538716 RepID=A0AAV5W3C7_9BILA|nr:hypothetical protein PFISCL1PPCAC_15711 [Pristionchus fissidentatus]
MTTEYINLSAQDETSGITEGKMKWSVFRNLKREDKKRKVKEDHLPDKVEIGEERLNRHTNDALKLDPKKLKSSFHQKKYAAKRKLIEEGIEKNARAEILNVEEEGFMETDNGECSYNVTQLEIVQNVDIASAAKCFGLTLPQFGPYRIDYSSNGRFLAMGGRKGHVAALDWQTKKLLFETNVLEKVNDVQFLHTETMMAVAQKNYSYIYDSTGTELHCLKNLHAVERLAFLPHHFLLVGSTRKSYIHWLDVSVGKIVTSTMTRAGPLDVMTVNPANAIIHTGHHNGTISLWSPNVKEPLIRMLAHHSTLRGIAVDDSGKYMYSTAVDQKLRVWDLRTHRQLYSYSLPFGLSEVTVSQKGLVACGIGNTVQVFNDVSHGICSQPYLVHKPGGNVSNLEFVPYEDVLGVGHGGGVASMLVPGAGEANVDALRNNPYETKKQRREREVKQLLDKIAPELISLDPNEINRVNTEALEEEIEKKKSVLWVKAPQIEFTPRHKMKGKGGGVNAARVKQIVTGEKRFKANKERGNVEKEVFGKVDKVEEPKTVLDRFKKKK